MASARRRARAPLIDRLFEEPHAFEFFQAVQVLERAVQHQPIRPAGAGSEKTKARGMRPSVSGPTRR